MSKTKPRQLKPIPDKRYFSIGEVSELCQLKPHVLHYWEQEFPQLAPAKRRGNRRYYQREDVLMVRQIQHLLYHEGFTIEGARGQLTKPTSATSTGSAADNSPLHELIEHLEGLLVSLSDVESIGA